MNFYLDIGNSYIKWLSGDSDVNRMNSIPFVTGDEAVLLSKHWKNEPVPERIIVASVAAKSIIDTVAAVCERLWSIKPEYLTVQKEFCGIVIVYDDVDKLGIDRWLALVAGFNRHKTNLCIADCGSAVTVDVVSASGRHQGGYIIPGIDMMKHALIFNTEKISISEEVQCTESLGRSTEECIHNGTQLAIAAFIDRVVTRSLDQYQGNLKCIMTGGGAEPIMKLMTTNFIYEPNLVLSGARLAGGFRKQ